MFTNIALLCGSDSLVGLLDTIARDTGLVRRRSTKFSPQAFLLSLLQSVSAGTSSCNHIARALGESTLQPMSRQALHKRLGQPASDFLSGVIGHLLCARLPSEQGDSRCLGLFSRIIIEDSTVLAMAASNADTFPGNGNCRGATAGCKIDWVYDLLSGAPLDASMQAARTPDQANANIVLDHAGPGDLVLRDMGYCTVSSLQSVGNQGAVWISRLPGSMALRDRDGTKIETILRKTRKNRLDFSAVLSSSNPTPCRVVASRLEPDDAAGARRRHRAESRRHGATANKGALLRCSWRILVTNAPKAQLSARLANDLYGFRWQVEIAFRAFKQSCQVERALGHRSNPQHITCLVLAAIIFKLLAGKALAACAASLSWSKVSPEKVYDIFADHLRRCRILTELLKSFCPDPRHVSRDRRLRVNPYELIGYSLG